MEGIDSPMEPVFSTPIVAGLLLILISALKAKQSAINPGLIKSVLCRSVNDLGHLHYTQGFGRINVSKMINLLSNHSLIDLPLVGPDQDHISGINRSTIILNIFSNYSN